MQRAQLLKIKAQVYGLRGRKSWYIMIIGRVHSFPSNFPANDSRSIICNYFIAGAIHGLESASVGLGGPESRAQELAHSTSTARSAPRPASVKTVPSATL